MKRFHCDCGNVLFFGSSVCLKCAGKVGFDPAVGLMVRVRPESVMKRCENGTLHGVCNWLLPAKSSAVLCLACQMNQTIPDLSIARNRLLWGRVEMAKRRMIHTLLDLGIGLLFVAVWLALVEPNPWRAAIWIAALLILGNVITLAYLLSRTCQARHVRDLFLPSRHNDWR